MKKQSPKSESDKCYRCGKDHHRSKCHFKDATCHYCKRKGHIVANCQKKARKSSEKFSNSTSSQQGKQRVHVLDTEEPDEEQVIYPLFPVNPSSHKNPYMVTVELNGLEVKMELDTGASLSVISEDVYTQLKNIEGSTLNLQDTKLTLKSYTGEIIPVLGTLSVEVKYKDFCEHLSVIVV